MISPYSEYLNSVVGGNYVDALDVENRPNTTGGQSMTMDEQTEQRERFDKRAAFNDFFGKLHAASQDEKTAYKRLALCETEHGYGSDASWVAFQEWEKAKAILEALEKDMPNFRWSK